MTTLALPGSARPTAARNSPTPTTAAPEKTMARTRKRILNRILNLLFSYPTDSWEFAASLFLISWGGWLIAFPANLDRPQLAAFVASAEGLPAGVPTFVVVGGLALLPGLLGFVGLFSRRFDRLRIAATLAEAAAFVTIAYGYGLVDYRMLTTPVFSLMALLTVLSLFRLLLTRRDVHDALGFVPSIGSPVSRSRHLDAGM